MASRDLSPSAGSSAPTSGHTPGPWTAEPAYHNRIHREIRTPGALIAVVGNLGDTSDHAPTRTRWKAETVANARLIAAAPDLLEAARAAEAHLRASGTEVWALLADAIAKATGAA